MAGKTLHFHTIVRNIKTGNLYACESKAFMFEHYQPDAAIEVFSRSCRQTRRGLVPRGRKNRIFHSTKIRRDFLEVVHSDQNAVDAIVKAQ